MDPSNIIRIRELNISEMDVGKVQDWLDPSADQALKIKVKTTISKTFDLTKPDYITLRDSVPLSAVIVNIYFSMMQQRENESNKNRKNLFVGHSFAELIFSSTNDKNLLQMDIFATSKIFFPKFCGSAGWMLCSADMQLRTLSFHGLSKDCDINKWSNAIFKWFADSVRGQRNPFTKSEWGIVDFTVSSPVINKDDSGVYILMCADFLSSEGDRILYNEEQVAKFRNLLLFDISRGFLNKVNKKKDPCLSMIHKWQAKPY